MWVMDLVAFIGMGLVAIGAVCDVLAAIGLLRFPNFFLRMHAATVGIVGGAVVPLIGVALVALGTNALGNATIPFVATSIFTAVFILITSPISTHILAHAAYHSHESVPQPLEYDALKRGGGE